MFKPVAAFSGFSVKDLGRTREFYTSLGLKVEDDETMGLNLILPGGTKVFMYPKDNHEPATFTVLNLIVEDIDKAVEELKERGITFDKVDLGGGAETDETGVMRGKEHDMGPNIAWFKDPNGNVVSIIEE